MKYVYDFYHYLIDILIWIYTHTYTTQFLYFLFYFLEIDIIQEKNPTWSWVKID